MFYVKSKVSLEIIARKKINVLLINEVPSAKSFGQLSTKKLSHSQIFGWNLHLGVCSLFVGKPRQTFSSPFQVPIFELVNNSVLKSVKDLTPGQKSTKCDTGQFQCESLLFIECMGVIHL